MSGLSATGYLAPRGDELLELIRDAYEAETGLVIDWDRDKVLGTFSAVVATRLGQLAEAQQALYDAFTLGNATGLQLDQLAAIAGVERLAAVYSTVTVACFGDFGTIIGEERQVEDDLAQRWSVLELITLGQAAEVLVKVADGGFDGTATYTISVDGNDVDVDASVGISTNAQLLQAFASAITGDATVSALVTATTDDLNGDTVDDALILDSVGGVVRTVTVSATGDGELWVGGYTTAQAQELGNIQAAALAIDTIVTPVTGWEEVFNPEAAAAGRPEEGDDTLRLRLLFAQQAAGSSSANALRANVLDVDGVTACVVLENDTPAATTIAGLSLDAHSVAVVVAPDTLTTAQQKSVALAIYERLCSGIKTTGTDVVTTVSGEALTDKTIAWDWATELTVDVATTVVLADGYALADVSETIQESIEDYFAARGPGDAVRILALLGLIADVEGVDGASLTLDAGSADVEPTAVQIPVLGTNAVGV